MWVILWTDALVYLLVVVALLGAWQVRRSPHVLDNWRRVARAPLGMAAIVVLGVYVVIGLADSVHYRAAAADGQVVSVLDTLLTPLRESTETSYSAPFATHAFTKVSTTHGDGTVTRKYPRLAHGGAHLEHPGQRGRDIRQRAVRALAVAALVWLALAAAAVGWVARRRTPGWRVALGIMVGGRDVLPWRTLLATLGVLLALLFLAVELAPRYHVLGTDKVGQDVFYQTLKSIRTGLVIGTLTTLVMLPFAIGLGVAAGYFGGLVDDVIQYVYTTLNSIPGVLLIAAAILTVQIYMANHAEALGTLEDRADLRLLALCIILGITSWTNLCRLLRAETLKLREVEYVQAALGFGVSHSGIIARHVVPNVMHIVLITVALDFSGLVLAEAVLSYVNIGVDPTTNSWGNMINSSRLEMAREPVVWWSLAAAFIFMFTMVLAANVFADAVRDAFDPRRS
ncbi:MAG: ABC transporter permease [Gammaproteobacteria bacterium]|nr:ABC transporter permease [Gammaproteobacteria bacterium]